MSSTNTPAVVTVTPTIMDGTVVRWHPDLNAATHRRPWISASRNGVSVHTTYLTDVPDEVVTAAREAYEVLRRDRHADLQHLATHRDSVVLNGPLVPADREVRGG
jgi:hypothetical protein